MPLEYDQTFDADDRDGPTVGVPRGARPRTAGVGAEEIEAICGGSARRLQTAFPAEQRRPDVHEHAAAAR